MSTELKEFQAEQRQMLERLDQAVNADNAASRKSTDDFMDWAMRRKQPNPRFDDEWKF